jgi:hypothetical protein
MPSFKVAHIHREGQEMIIFPVAAEFGQLPGMDQDRELAFLGSQANRAGLRGVAVVVWETSLGQVTFRAPIACYSCLSGINMEYVMANVNREISW